MAGGAEKPGSSIPQAQVRLILRQVPTLPTLAPVASRLLMIDASSTVDLGEIARLVESDPVLAGRILGLCRKADKGVTEKISSIRRAVVLVGLDAVRAAALGASAFCALGDRREGRDSGFDRPGFWKYCVCVACASELLANHNRSALRVVPDEAFVAGLLHAVGKLVLDHVLPKTYRRVIDLARRDGVNSSVLEQKLIGVDSHQAGAALAEHWRLPRQLWEVISFCATPFEELPETEHKTLIALVAASAALVRQIGIGWSGDFGVPESFPVLLPTANVRPPDMKEFGARLLRALSDRLSALQISDSGPEALAMEALGAATSENRELLRQIRELQHALHQARTSSSSDAASENAQPTPSGVAGPEAGVPDRSVDDRAELLALLEESRLSRENRAA
jgi:HD-like signal output (HDOD) protein